LEDSPEATSGDQAGALEKLIDRWTSDAGSCRRFGKCQLLRARQWGSACLELDRRQAGL